MFLKNKTLRILLIIIICLIILYTGISFGATLYRANTQPYLISDLGKFKFMGFYIISATNGFICLIFILILINILLKNKKKEN